MRRLVIGMVLAMALCFGCKQGEGEVCQINDDCEDGLSCNAGTGRCQAPGAAVIDAMPPGPDADPADAAPVDAEVPDADPSDAGEPDSMP